MRTLRPYQQAALDSTLRMLQEVDSALIVIPTGGGKTVVMAKLAVAWDKGNVLLLAHREELINQSADKLSAELGYRPVIEQAQRGCDPDDIWLGGITVVGSVQTLRSEKRLSKFDKNPFGLILIDEAHHATAASYRKIIDYCRQINPQVKVVGVTATPNRSDRTALGIIFNGVSFEMDIVDATDQGWLVPVRQFPIVVESVDFDGIRSGKNKLGETDFIAEELETVLIEEEALHGMAQPLLDNSNGEPTLIFTAGVAHAHLLADILNRHKPQCAAAVDGNTDKERVRPDLVKRFADGQLEFLINHDIFTEGFDCPNCSKLAICRPTKSMLKYLQMLGRVLRPLDGVVDGYNCDEDRKMSILTSNKPFASVYDFVGASRHGTISAIDALGGNFDIHEREAAKEIVEKAPGTSVKDALERARAFVMLNREQMARREIKASAVAYSMEEMRDGSGRAAAHGVEQTRGGCSDAQIQFLVNLGVQYETAARYSKRQAGAVITSLKQSRCTVKQRSILEKYGESPDVNFDKAKELIDAIAKNGWRPLRK